MKQFWEKLINTFRLLPKLNKNMNIEKDVKMSYILYLSPQLLDSMLPRLLLVIGLLVLCLAKTTETSHCGGDRKEEGKNPRIKRVCGITVGLCEINHGWKWYSNRQSLVTVVQLLVYCYATLGARLNLNIPSCQQRNSHHKIETISRPLWF